MSIEIPSQEKEVLKYDKKELYLDSEKDLGDFSVWLGKFLDQESTEQCIFVLRSMAEEDFVNQCDEMTKEFGKRLNERFGEEESFFDLVPSASFSDLRSTSRLHKTRYTGDYHDVGLIVIDKEKEKSISLVFDLTYGNVVREGSRKNVLVIGVQGDRKAALNVLNNHYGGKWEVNLEFDKNKGDFTFVD